MSLLQNHELLALAPEAPAPAAFEAACAAHARLTRLFPPERIILGSAGDDTISPGGGNDTVCAGDGYDYIYGSTGTDWIDGGNGDCLFLPGRKPVCGTVPSMCPLFFRFLFCNPVSNHL